MKIKAHKCFIAIYINQPDYDLSFLAWGVITVRQTHSSTAAPLSVLSSLPHKHAVEEAIEVANELFRFDNSFLLKYVHGT